MSPGDNTVTAYFAAIGGALLIGLILFAPWPLWASFAATLALMVAALLTRRTRRRSVPSSESEGAYPAPLPVERRATPVTDVLLPSNGEDYYFLFSAMVHWSPLRAGLDESMVNMNAIAIETILNRAREITEQRDPGHVSLVQHELGSALGTMRADATGYLHAMAESVRLVLPDHDSQRLERLAAVRKKKAIWEHERKYEQSKREYLGGDVLKDPGSAVVWWLAKNDDQVAKAVNDIELLTRLTSAANNIAIPESAHRLPPSPESASTPDPLDPHSPWHNGSDASSPPGQPSPGDHLDTFMRSMGFGDDHPERGLLVRRVANVLALHEREEAADEIVRRFDTPIDFEEGKNDGN